MTDDTIRAALEVAHKARVANRWQRMTPEQIAADRIARAVEKRTGWSVETARDVGRRAVEDMAAAGLVIMTAERAAELIHAPRWQPIETAPKDGTRVDVWSGDRFTDARWCARHKQWEVFIPDYNGGEWTGVYAPPTHWMPLPAPPVETARG
jgi:hypothetical protein